MSFNRLSQSLLLLLALGVIAGCVTRGSGAPPAPAAVGRAIGGGAGTGFPPSAGPTTAGPGSAGTVGAAQMPVDLPTVLRLASGRSYDVRVIQERVREAYAEMVHAGQWLVPSATVGVRYFHNDGNVQATEGPIIDVNKENAFGGANIVLDWQVGDGIFNTLAAKQRSGARRAELSAGINDAMLMAGEAYFDLVRAQTAAEIAGQSVALYGTFVEESTASAAAGEGFKGDVLNARSRLAHARVQQRRATGQAQVAAVRLRELLDLPPSVSVYAAEPQPVPLSLIDSNADQGALIAEAMRGRPEIRAASMHSRAARAEHNKTSSGPLYPDVRVGYEGGAFGDGFDSLGGRSQIGIGIGWKVGRGGIGDTSRIAAAAARARRARLRVQQVRQAVVRDVASAQAQAQAAGHAIEAGRAGAKDAEQALSLYQQRQKLGVGQPFEAVLAEETLTQARTDLLDANVDFNKAQLRLLRAVGRRP